MTTLQKSNVWDVYDVFYLHCCVGTFTFNLLLNEWKTVFTLLDRNFEYTLHGIKAISA